MSKAKNSSKVINWIAGGALAYFIGTAIAGAIKRKRESTNGIGAAKRRIFKELSLAQKAGVDFTKKYDELDEAEIKALEKVSSDTGYTETYYKSLKKAYDAVSGIGATYDVVNADGNTVLTWTDAPGDYRMDDSDRWRALREAHDIEDDRMWATENAAQLLAEREARLAEQRKRIKKAGRSSQMALFGVSEPTYSRRQLDAYLGAYHIAELVAQYESKNKVSCSVGDEKGGRGFYLGRDNFLYLFNYCLMRGIPIAVWTGDHWLTRNNGDELISGCGYTDEVEAELYEIWREQLEYGNTERDYDSWRLIYGDEFAKAYVLPYMH